MLATTIGPLLSILLLVTISTYPSHHLNTKIATYTLNHLPHKIRKLLPTKSKFRAIITAGLTAFFESAIYFALAIEIATLAILAPKDYESQTVSFGDYDSRTCSLVSTICLLPLLYPVSILSFLGSPPTENKNEASHTPNLNKPPSTRDEQIHHKQPYRLTLFSIAVLISIYPFMSQSFRTWSPSQIGEGNGDGGATYVTAEEWQPVENICFHLDGATSTGGVSTLTGTEHVVMGVFQTVSSCVVILFAVGMLIPGALRRLDHWFHDDELAGHGDDTMHGGWGRFVVVVKAMMRVCDGLKKKCRTSNVLVGFLLFVPLGLGAPLLWGLWRLRALQGQLARAAGQQDEGGDWSFGQVVAITIFLPVGADMIFTAVCGVGEGH